MTHTGDDPGPGISAVLTFPSARELARRLPPCVAGIVLIGVSIGVSVRARLGVAPWDVFHQGLAERTGLSFGTVVIAVGAVVLITWFPLHQRAGLGTVVNVLLVGTVADLVLAHLDAPHGSAVRLAMLTAAITGFGLGGGLYIGSGLGPGPRDGMMTAITARGHKLWVVRTLMEITVLALGWAMGGNVGMGTVVIAVTIGPATHVALRWFHLPVHADAQDQLGE